MNIHSSRALGIGCFDWQIWQANDNTQALWLLYRYISEAKITALIIFVMAFTLTGGSEWIPLVGWKLKDTSLCQICNFLPFFISSHLRMAQFKLSEKNSKFWIQSLSHFQWSYYLEGLRSFVQAKFSVHGLLVCWVCLVTGTFKMDFSIFTCLVLPSGPQVIERADLW